MPHRGKNLAAKKLDAGEDLVLAHPRPTTHASYGLWLVSTSLENALMPSADLDRHLVRYPYAAPYKDRQQRDRDADERGPNEEPNEARMLDHEAREPSQNATWEGAEGGRAGDWLAACSTDASVDM